ncbi:Tetratricopeptide-like helical [Penicillium griseofulvum]|uniref:Tetratricopeptide-like helical n=1 Tax=Penicillium patulum TaxID=5078 RepID=A0A135L9K0_PENPA|nr:Tetratricopeptide-like helical [Penicillium griseofulvum]KXG45629.1 Tetratricopeptide-like helical [Penicillium griseofulvum]
MNTINFGERNSGSQVGINNGVINLGAEPQELRPDPISTVPVPHDPDFVSRDDLLNRIQGQSSVPGSRIVLVGLGGVGKTRLAAEYCHQLRQRSPHTWVFWVHASNAARCEESLRNIAERAKIPGRSGRNTNIFQLFGNWLQDGKIGEWILVLDNLDDDELLRKPFATCTDDKANFQSHHSTQPPLKYILASSNGSTIITSRNRGQSAADLLSLMSFFDRQGIPADLLRVQEKEKNHESLGSLGEEIPDSSSEEDTDSSSEDDLEDGFENDITTLRDYSFITTCKDSTASIKIRRDTGPYFRMSGQPYYIDRNRKTRSEVGLRYSTEGREAEQLEVQVIETRKTNFSVDHPDTLTSMAILASTYSHQGRWEDAEQLRVQVIGTSMAKLGVDHPSTLISIGNLAVTYSYQGRWEKAEQLEIQVMETRKTKLGVDHPDTLTSMANLAATYSDQGRWEEAEQLEIQVMETRKTKLGMDHPDTLTSMANRAAIYSHQGRWEDAEQLRVQVMGTSMAKLGVDHPSTLISMGNLAVTYSDQGRWEEAEQLEVQVMETHKTKFGVDHPDTLTSMANLAFTWKSTGQHAKAISLLRACVIKQRQIIGPTHPNTISNGNLLLEWETADGDAEDIKMIDSFEEAKEREEEKLSAGSPDKRGHTR